MDAGLKINGDPIIYLGIPEEWQLRALQPERFDGEAEVEDQGRRNTLTDQLLRKTVIVADLTPLQAWVLILKAFGVKQEQIASTLRVTRQAVIRATKSAVAKINVRALEV